MNRPYIWIILMVVISILSLSQSATLSIFSGMALAGPAVILAWLIYRVPMVILAILDHFGLKRRGCDPPNLLITVIFAAILPSYIFTFGYLIFRSPLNLPKESEQRPAKMSTEDKSENDDTRFEIAQGLLDNYDDKWREIDGKARYEVDLPGGETATAQTKDDVRAILFKNYGM